MSLLRQAVISVSVCSVATLIGTSAFASGQDPLLKKPMQIRPPVIEDPAGSETILVASSKIKPAAELSGQSGLDQVTGAESDDSDLFGVRGGYFHPYITLGTEYTDNVFNIAEDTTSSWVGRVAPGVWFALPRTRTVPIQVAMSNTSAGGLVHSLKDIGGTERYQAYALGGLDYRAYSDDSDLNTTDGRLEGLFRYNFRGGLSLQVLDTYNHGQDRFAIDAATDDNLRTYDSNIIMGTADYDITEKLRAKFDYSNFMLDYDDEENDFLDRSDNVADLYGYFKYSPKTSFYLQYRYVDVGYDSATEKDNKQHYGYGGIQWYSTDKVSLDFKAGYQTRDYEESLVSESYDWDGFTFDLRSQYRVTEKTQMSLDAYSRSEESDSGGATDKLVLGALFNYQQKFTEKISGVVDFLYEKSDYSEVVDLDRDDDRIYIKPALRYVFRDWMMTELAYSFDKRDSSDDIFDYDSNTFMLNFNFTM